MYLVAEATDFSHAISSSNTVIGFGSDVLFMIVISFEIFLLAVAFGSLEMYTNAFTTNTLEMSSSTMSPETMAANLLLPI